MRNHHTKKFISPLLHRFSNKNTNTKLTGQHLITAEALSDDIRCHLEKLLNARTLCVHWPKHLKQLDQSLLNYGIEDFTHQHFNNEALSQALCESITKIIQRFEPRLNHIKVQLLQNEHDIERELHIRIEATIVSNINQDSTVFESNLDITRQRFRFE